MAHTNSHMVIDLGSTSRRAQRGDSGAAPRDHEHEAVPLSPAPASSHSGHGWTGPQGRLRPISEPAADGSLSDVTDALREVFGDHHRF